MPATRPRASFEPLPPDIDVRELVEHTENFEYVDRISWEVIAQQGMDAFEKLVLKHVIQGGKPLVVDGFEDLLDPWTFTPRWLVDNHGDKIENARNLTSNETLPLTIGHYMRSMGKLADQFFEKRDNYKDKARQRVYLKDIDCPTVWHDKLKEHLPQGLTYLNESTGEIGGPGSVDEPIPNAAGMRKGKGIARAGDLMSSLPMEMRADNLMCYIGHEGTYTPSHREMCASLGQNIMVEASGTVGEHGKPEKIGSSIWFMTESSDRNVVSEYWLSVLGHDIEVENHFAQVVAWQRAPFKTYVVEQRAGDFILIPPLAPHQVWNRGTRTMKIAWNRTTVDTLEMALHEALPNSRIVCRDEQYKNKAIVYYTLSKYSKLLRQARAQYEAGGVGGEAIRTSKKVRQVQLDFKRLFELYKEILLSEMFAPDSREHAELLPFESFVTCAYCRCNIFNRFLSCKSCTKALGTQTDEPYDICMDCYVMGRSCGCISDLKWTEQWKWKELNQRYEEWRKQIMEIDGGITEQTPLPLQEERRYHGKKSLAQICQEQLKLRPWNDVKKSKVDKESDEDEEIIVNEDGYVKKTTKKKSKSWLNNHKACHVCCHRHPQWKMAPCTKCDLWWCYGTLFRGHDIIPRTVMEDPNWECPHCQRRCNAGACRRNPRNMPYEPKGTLLGHDTRKVADARSVEALVDFSVSNLNWLGEGPTTMPFESQRLQVRRQEAEDARRQSGAIVDEDDERRADGVVDDHVNGTNGTTNGDFIDPALGGSGVQTDTGLPTISSMLNNSNDADQYDSSMPYGYDYQEPSEVIPYDGDAQGGYDSLFYGRKEVNGETRKRKRVEGEIKLTAQRKRPKKDSAQPVNEATKEFMKQQERRQLEEAKKAGRFIQVFARMKGKSKVVKLQLDPSHLAAMRQQQRPQPAARPAQIPDGVTSTPKPPGNVLLQSDVLNAGSGATAKAPAPKPLPKQVRVRVEEDDDFRLRNREKKSTGLTSKSQKKKSPWARVHYEQVDISSGDEDEELEEYVNDLENGEGATSSRKDRTAPSYVKERHKRVGDEPLVELPQGFRDRGRKSQIAKEKPVAQIRPSVRKPVDMLRDDDDADIDANPVHVDDVGDADEDASAQLLTESQSARLTPTKPTPTAVQHQESPSSAHNAAAAAMARKAAAMLEEENRQAKLLAAGIVDEDAVEGADADQAEEIAKHPESAAPPTALALPEREEPRSIFPSMASRGRGKKVKMVSAASVRQSSDTPTRTFPSVNGPAFAPAKRSEPQVLEISSADEDTDSSVDEIPARLPSKTSEAKASFTSIRGRGQGTARRGRGRGRPRKSY